MNAIINTAHGPKTPEEAVQLIKNNSLNVGVLVGILNQLAEKAETFGQDTARYIIHATNKYDEKVVKVARRLLDGGIRPGATVQIGCAQHLYQVLARMTAGQKLKLFFSADAETVVADYLLGMSQSLVISFLSRSDAILMMAVSQSGSWSGQENRIVTVIMVGPGNPGHDRWFVERLHRRLDKVEIVA